jgi:hypothetical protein
MISAIRFPREMVPLLFLTISASAAIGGDEPRKVQEATADSIESFVQARKMKVLTFTGYSGAEYEDPKAMLEHASRILDGLDPATTLNQYWRDEDGYRRRL